MINKLFAWNSYHNMLVEEFFYVCKDKDVLEIAPMVGNQTQAISKYPIKSLTLVEPIYYEPPLNERFPMATVIKDDIFKVYQNKLLVDVVVACGLLYHLHNPFQLLELIVNQSDPEYIILDSLDNLDQITVTPEILNIGGNRFGTNNWKHIEYNIILPFRYINHALVNLGYDCIKNLDLSPFNVPGKERSWMALWKKRQTNG